MSVLIKGMEMPTSCYKCPLQDDECFGSIKCQYVKTWGSARMRAVDCPLVPVLTPYGRLIDADAFAAKIIEIIEQQGYDDAIAGSLTIGEILRDVVHELKGDGPNGFSYAPTVIPAEEGEI